MDRTSHRQKKATNANPSVRSLALSSAEVLVSHPDGPLTYPPGESAAPLTPPCRGFPTALLLAREPPPRKQQGNSALAEMRMPGQGPATQTQSGFIRSDRSPERDAKNGRSKSEQSFRGAPHEEGGIKAFNAERQSSISHAHQQRARPVPRTAHCTEIRDKHRQMRCSRPNERTGHPTDTCILRGTAPSQRCKCSTRQNPRGNTAPPHEK